MIKPVSNHGWDNYTFHLGSEMLVRLPSEEQYEHQVEKECLWLPKLAPFLPISIPECLAIGRPDKTFPLSWSIFRWIPGETFASKEVFDLCLFAKDLASFLKALHQIDSHGGPLAGKQSFYRGGSLKKYDKEVQKAIGCLGKKIPKKARDKSMGKSTCKLLGKNSPLGSWRHISRKSIGLFW